MDFGRRQIGSYAIAAVLSGKKKIPLTQKELTELPGIGRKSANVIIREAGGEPQGIIVDLHVLRVVTAHWHHGRKQTGKNGESADGTHSEQILECSWHVVFSSWPGTVQADKSSLCGMCDEQRM